MYHAKQRLFGMSVDRFGRTYNETVEQLPCPTAAFSITDARGNNWRQVLPADSRAPIRIRRHLSRAAYKLAAALQRTGDTATFNLLRGIQRAQIRYG